MKNTYDILLLKFLLLLALIGLYYYTKPVKRDLFRYKIHYFYFNWVCVISYIIGYFGFLLLTRIQYLSEISDLRIPFNIVYFYYKTLTLVNFVYLSCLILLLILNICYIFAIIHRFFINEVIKRVLILHNCLPNFYSLQKYTIIRLERNIIHIVECVYFPIKYYLSAYNFERLRKRVLFVSEILVMKLPLVLFVIFFCYEIYFNNYKLSPNFYAYLLFYFIYNIYKRISLYILNSDPFIREMVFNMYYKRGSIMYVDIADELENIVYDFVNNGLYRDPTINPVPILDHIMGEFEWLILMEHKFTSTDRYLYVNATNKCFEEPNNIYYDVPLCEYITLRKYWHKLMVVFYGANYPN